jgi:hypothetical protein
MKKRILTAGVAVLVLLFVTGLAGCASTDQRALKKAGIPQDQRVSLYLVMEDTRIEKVDGKRHGDFETNMWGLIPMGIPGSLKKAPTPTQQLELRRTIQLAPGEHTLVVSDKALVGRKSYTGTFDFEAGKRYVVRLTTPTTYEAMMKGGAEGLGEVGDALKESLAGNQIIIIAESITFNKPTPTHYDSNIKNNMWIRSREAEAAANAGGSGE